MSGIDFAAPEWVHGIWGVVALVLFLLWCERRGSGALEQFVSRSMQPRLVERPTTSRRVTRIACLGLSALALVVALMRPQWGATFISTPRTGAEIMVCLDVSKSMLAEDVAPNRLERAKADIQDLLPYLQGDQVGLIAFAGKATVLCPLTEDFGFFRLVLDEVSTHSVARGGTQLAEPIRKAVAGFGEVSDLSRAIILITDGEDHDSFPKEAAEAAVERGVKLIAIGFGDEVRGSEIRYTDPRTGATQTVMYEGRPVVSHLDGDTLRELASMSQGVYVPAGTGVLDLKSIYDRHIAPLTRGALAGNRRVVRQEGYQYAVMAGLIFLGIAAALTGGGARLRAGAAQRAQAAAMGRSAVQVALVALVALLASSPGMAQTASTPRTGDAASNRGTTNPGTHSATGATTADQDEHDRTAASASADPATPASAATDAAGESLREVAPEDARQVYNQALERLHGDDLEAAEKLLVAARSAAHTDVELRYSACYNLGFLAAKRADRLRADEPAKAIEQYAAAADWFRESIRLRADEADPRHNLEVVLKASLALSDQLRKRDPSDLAKQLEELANAQRQLAAATTELVSQVATLTDPNEISALRSAFRELERGQRLVSSDTGQVAETAQSERDGIETTAEAERTPEQRIRAIQLDNLLHYLHRARERMDQSRRQFRQKQAERGYRRAAAALTELKRARDQLRDPVEVLGAVITDLDELGRYTAAVAAAPTGFTSPTEPSAIPPWLTPEYLEETQVGLLERTTELRERLEAGLAAQETQPESAAPTNDPQGNDPAATPGTDEETERMLAQVRTAMPHVQRGEQALEQARGHLEKRVATEAVRAQGEGLQALLDARECFLDLRGLIETLYADEKKLEQVLAARHATDGAEPAIEIDEYLPQLAALQAKNLTRAERLSELLDEALAKATTSASPASGQPPQTNGDESDPQALEKQRVELAKQYLASATVSMSDAHDTLATTAQAGSASDEQLRTTDELVLRAVESIEALRRLYFSIIEHLQEAARRQSELNDETEEAATIADAAELPTRLGPLAPRQRDLESLTGSIGDALTKQAQQNPAGSSPGAPGQPAADDAAKQQAEQLARAAELVTAARGDMTTAASSLDELVSAATALPADALPVVRKHQDDALRLLLEALALLQPPQPQDQQQQQQQQQQEQQQGEGEQSPEEKQPQPSADPAQQLQGVRDREAQRRRDKEERKSRGYEAVEKDW
ncbi:MAG: VWA domain-containing protein [Planctomycetota bacterium]